MNEYAIRIDNELLQQIRGFLSSQEGDGKVLSERLEDELKKKTETKARKEAQAALAGLLKKTYFDAIPIADISTLLECFGFDPDAMDAIYCGDEGEVVKQVGPNTWMRMTWYKMPSGRYEIIGYLS